MIYDVMKLNNYEYNRHPVSNEIDYKKEELHLQ